MIKKITLVKVAKRPQSVEDHRVNIGESLRSPLPNPFSKNGGYDGRLLPPARATTPFTPNSSVSARFTTPRPHLTPVSFTHVAADALLPELIESAIIRYRLDFLTSLVSITLVSICFWLTSKKLQTGCAKAVVRRAVCLQKKAFK